MLYCRQVVYYEISNMRNTVKIGVLAFYIYVSKHFSFNSKIHKSTKVISVWQWFSIFFYKRRYLYKSYRKFLFIAKSFVRTKLYHLSFTCIIATVCFKSYEIKCVSHLCEYWLLVDIQEIGISIYILAEGTIGCVHYFIF